MRRANYVYGAAKAGLDGFASGLGDALHGSGVRLLLVRPGFVIGRMTAGMRQAPLSSTPEQVADAVVDGLRRGRTRVWVPGALRPPRRRATGAATGVAPDAEVVAPPARSSRVWAQKRGRRGARAIHVAAAAPSNGGTRRITRSSAAAVASSARSTSSGG